MMTESYGIPQSVMDTAERLYEHCEYYHVFGGKVTVETFRGEVVEFEIDAANTIHGNIAVYSDVHDRDEEDGLYRVMINKVVDRRTGEPSSSLSFTREGRSNIRLGEIALLEVEATDDG